MSDRYDDEDCDGDDTPSENRVARCKFRLTEITPYDPGDGATVKLTAHYDPESTIPEDQAFTKYTPTGNFSAFITNPNVLSALKVGSYYYVAWSKSPPP